MSCWFASTGHWYDIITTGLVMMVSVSGSYSLSLAQQRASGLPLGRETCDKEGMLAQKWSDLR